MTHQTENERTFAHLNQPSNVMFRLFTRRSSIILLAIVVISFLLRLYNAGTYSIYYDEKATLLISQGICIEGANQKEVFSKKYFTPKEYWRPKTIADFVEANARGDIGSPFYFAVLWSWLDVFGLSDLSLRMPSILFSTFTVLLLYIFIAHHFLSRQLALIGCSVMAIEPFFLAYSQMARTYSLTFFLTLLATHVFLLIIEKYNKNSGDPPRATNLYIAYSVLFALCVLSHYLTVTVFLCHALYALIYLRQLRPWVSLGISALVGLLLVVPWFVWGSGRYHFITLNYQAEFYRNIALTNPYGTGFGTILPATIPNIAKRAIPIFADLFIFTNGLGSALTGIKNSILGLGLGGLATIILHRFWSITKPPTWVYVALPLVFASGLLVYSVAPLRFLVLSVAPPFIYLIARYITDRTDNLEKRIVVMLLLLAFVPTFFLLFMAWRSGHTFGITQRYSGFSFPYVCVLVAMGLQQLATLRRWFSIPLTVILLIQLGFIVQLIGNIYAGTEPKYTYFSQPRIANPYRKAAFKLQEQYMPGDTILYPNANREIFSEKMDRTYSPVALLDAQLVNVYLPRDAQYIQRVDPNERNRIVLVKRQTGQKILIFDFEGTKYRY